MLPVEAAQTASAPAIVQLGISLTVTVFMQELKQPLREMLSVTVYVPAAPAVTLIEAPVVEPTIVPFPEIVQLWVTVPPAGSTVDV